MKAEIISIGTELLLGSITDTNATFLTQRLADLGIDCYFVSQVGDNQARIVETLRRAIGRSDLTITTGGLGPTGDDLTRESIADFLSETPVVVPELEAELRAFFAKRAVSMPEQNIKQATVIPSAKILRNPIGTAPGWLVTAAVDQSSHNIVSMPGVPFEMKRMWQEEVEPWLRPQCPEVLVSRTLKVMGYGESAVEEQVMDLMTGANPTLAPYAKADGINLRITAKAPHREAARALIVPVETEIRRRLGDAVYAADDETPADVVIGLLTATGVRLALLEVGDSAFGAVTRPLASYEKLVASVAAHGLSDVQRLLSDNEPVSSLADATAVLLRRSESQAILSVQVIALPGASADSVGVEAEMIVAATSDFNRGRVVTARSTWNTAKSEVSRLVGLNALNLLRKWLIEGEQGNESR